MKRTDIKNAYDRICPDQSAKDRMLSTILEKESQSKNAKYCLEPQNAPIKWWKIAPAAMLLIFAVVIFALGESNFISYIDEDTYDPTQQTFSCENTETDLTDWQIVEETTYYKIQEKNSLFSYTIYDKNGNPVRTESNLTHYPQIGMLDQGLIRVIVQGGTGIGTQSGFYYDVERNLFSVVFSSIFDEIGFLVAYVETDKVIVRNIFDDEYYQEITQFSRSFSQTVNPFISVKFEYTPNDDNIHVRVVYLSGEEYEEVTESIRLDDKANLLGGMEYDFSPSEYDAVLELYKKAIEQGWSAENCIDSGISYLTSYLDSPEQLGYLLTDLDGDGNDELIISDGTVIYDLYTLTDGAIKNVLSGHERNYYVLCENNVIANRGSNGAADTTYNFYEFVDGQLALIEIVKFNATISTEAPWFWADGGDGTCLELEPITEEQANEIIESYVPAEPELKSIPELSDDCRWRAYSKIIWMRRKK